MSERIILDPSEKAEGRTEVDITAWVDVEGIDWGDAEMEAYKAEAQTGESVLGYRLPNRQIVAPLIIKEAGGTSFAKARSYIQAKAARYIQEGGIGKRILSTGGTVYFDIVANGLTLGGDWLQGNRDVDVNAELRLEAIPDFYEPEELVAEAEEKTATELVKVIPDPGGDMPARVRIVVEEKQGADQKSLIWSFRSRHYSSAATAKVAYEAEELSPLGEASKGALSGASGGTVVSHTALPAIWTPVVGTNRSGTSFLTHTGTNRVFVRLRSPDGTAVSGRLVWDVGDLVNPTENEAFTIPGGSAFYTMDAGEVRLDPPPIGTHRWQGQFQFKGTEGGEDIQVDKVWIVNADEGMGVLSSPPRASTTNETVAAWDNFNSTTAGTITGKTAPLGGTWTGAGDAVGFPVDTTNLRINRAEKSDADLNTGYYARLGTGTAAAVAAEVDLFVPTRTEDMVDKVRRGVFVRCADTSNWLLVVYEVVKPGVLSAPDWRVRVYKRVSGTVTRLGESSIKLTENRWKTLKVTVSAAGAVQVYTAPQGATLASVVSTSPDSTLATGGGLEKGGYGIYDAYTGAEALTRLYDNFYVTAPVTTQPTADAVLFASQKAQLTTSGMYRLDAGGSAYGPISRVVGDLPRLPGGGLEGRTPELLLKASRGDMESLPDSAIDDVAVKVYASRCWLTVPGTI